MDGLSPVYSHAEVYDAFYEGRDRPYEAEEASRSRMLAKHVKERNASASSLLDVACGTGRNLGYFAEAFEHVEGMDLSEDMLRVAGKRLPGVPLHRGDMQDFRLDRRFDAITCLFSSIAYLDDAEQLNTAMRCFGRHLNPGGVIVIEPWYLPEKVQAGRVTSDVVTINGQTIARVSHTVLEGRVFRMDAHFVVADSESGIQHFADLHLLTMFTRQEYETAVAEAGVASVEFVETGQGGPGLFIGVKPS
ncbi:MULTISPECIES: class I SAM-dependent DNA methyltransferase [unclassified Streptosporangium]|uniref:class I SAM-dependent DNA methyltransferase n=1 Tax=unclassified Streptosporangium TaxID=2632669 RepID=UPI002E2E76C6|nr:MULTISPECIES: methyltransferase domain-containing protein [unclassified Streptosporangium]